MEGAGSQAHQGPEAKTSSAEYKTRKQRTFSQGDQKEEKQ